MIKGNIFSILTSLIFGIFSSNLTIHYLNKNEFDWGSTSGRIKGVICSLISSLFISIPVVVITIIVILKTESKPQVGIAIATYGGFGSIVMIIDHVRRKVLKKKFNRLFFGALIGYLSMFFIGLGFIK